MIYRSALLLLLFSCGSGCGPTKPYRITVSFPDGRQVFSVVRKSNGEPDIYASSRGVLKARVHSAEDDVYAPPGCVIKVEAIIEREAAK